MSFQLVLQAEAIIDIQEAFDWYEAEKPGLGYEFIAEIEEGYEKICNHPLLYAAINERYRRLKIIRFPFLIWRKTLRYKKVTHCATNYRGRTNFTYDFFSPDIEIFIKDYKRNSWRKSFILCKASERSRLFI